MSDFSKRIINWQRQHGRHNLPWQGADAYHVWLSEIMLQQTRVDTVIPYYQRFISSFPNVAALAAASEEVVLAHWSGLGYYARARNLHRAAQHIMQLHSGEFPNNFDDILALSGIGRSTAAAICALAFKQRYAILDGNVKRVLARYCAIEGYTGDQKIEAQLWQQAEKLLPPLPSGERGGPEDAFQFQFKGDTRRRRANDEDSTFSTARSERGSQRSSTDKLELESIATYTQALMDLGALICTRSKPLCNSCPVQTDCVACQTGQVAQLPTPRPRKVIPERHSTFLLLLNGNDILLEKRPGSGIWGGLWCPPQVDEGQDVSAYCAQHFAVDATQALVLPVFTHTFTHFKLHITSLRFQVQRKHKQVEGPGRVWLDVGDALQAAIPAPVRKILQELLVRRM